MISDNLCVQQDNQTQGWETDNIKHLKTTPQSNKQADTAQHYTTAEYKLHSQHSDKSTHTAVLKTDIPTSVRWTVKRTWITSHTTNYAHNVTADYKILSHNYY